MFSSHDTSLISSCQIQVPQVRILFCLVLRCFINDLISYLLCQLSGGQRLKAYGLEAHPWHREGWNGAREHQETSKHHVSKLQQTSNDMIRLMIGHSISFEIHPKSKAFFKIDSCISRGVWCLISSDFLLHSMEDPAQLTLWKLVRSLNFWRTRRQEVNWKFLRL